MVEDVVGLTLENRPPKSSQTMPCKLAGDYLSRQIIRFDAAPRPCGCRPLRPEVDPRAMGGAALATRGTHLAPLSRSVSTLQPCVRPHNRVTNMTDHYLVWVDHREAKIFAVGIEESQTQTIDDQGPVHHVHSKPDHIERARSSAERTFLAEVANALLPAKAIMIVGPGNARTELGEFLKERFPAIAKPVWINEAADHPTAPQLIARARSYFRTEAGMHG